MLAISGNHEQLKRLESIFAGSSWTLYPVATFAAARDWLSYNSVPVILSESRLPDGCWKDVLRLTEEMDPAPNLVVASALADDRLWAEVLNLGGYDVIALPCSRAELFRTISGAWRNWKARCADPGSTGMFPAETAEIRV